MGDEGDAGRRRVNRLTAAEIAAFLGLTAAGVRKMVEREGIRPVGKEGRAHLYDARPFIDKVGGHDRRVARKRRRPMSQ